MRDEIVQAALLDGLRTDFDHFAELKAICNFTLNIDIKAFSDAINDLAKAWQKSMMIYNLRNPANTETG